MANNRFEYSEICPTCKAAGIVGEDEKPISLGFDIDTSTICCVMGHEFETLPSEASVVASQGDKSQDSATGALQTDETGTSPEGSRIEAFKPSSDEAECHSLEPDVAETDAANAQADSAALAQLSKQMESPALEIKAAAVINEKTPEYGLPGRVVLSQPETGNVQFLVAEGQGLTLPNGDLLLGLCVPEQWRQAIEAEAQNQMKGNAQYLSDWLTSEEMRSAIIDALVSYWSSSFTQTV